MDTVKPRVGRVVPASNAAGIHRSANVVAFFSEAMTAGTVNAGSVKLYKKGSRSPVAATVTYRPAARKATLDPKADLRPGVTYKVVIAGARDAAGNVLDQNPGLAGSQPKAWYFTVKR